MTFAVNSLVVFLLMLPYFVQGALATFMVDGVLKYEVKHKRIVYISLALFGATFGAVEAVIGVSSASDVIFIGELESLLIYGVTVIVLAIFIKAKWWKKILVSFLSVNILLSVDSIFEVIRDQIAERVSDEIFALFPEATSLISLLVMIFSSLFIELLEFAFLLLLKRLRSKNDNQPLPMPVMLTISLLLDAFVTIFSSVLDDLDTVDYKKIITLLSMLLTLMFLALYFYIRVTRKERDDLKDLNHVNEELVASQAKFFESSARSDNEIRAMRHDMRNNIQVLKLLLGNGEYDKMGEYLDEMGDNLASADISAHTGDTIADAIIADKTALAQSHKLTLKSSGSIAGVEISPVDMCKILANLLDNAIEAASVPELAELDDSLRAIELQFRKTDNFFMISVTNPCFTSPKIENGRIVSSKIDRKNHGFGIHNIETASEGYGGELTVSCEEKPYGYLFRAEIVFPISSNS